MIHLRPFVITALLFGGAGARAATQDSSKTPVASRAVAQDTVKMSIADRVVAVVGKTPITQSMVDEELFSTPTYTPEVVKSWTPEVLKSKRRMLVDTLIAAELLFQEAVRDTSIKVNDAEVAERTDAIMKQKRASLPGPGQFDAALHQAGYKSADEFRIKLLEQTKRQFYTERFSAELHSNGTIKSMNPTEREVRAYYDAQVAAGTMEMIPPSIAFKQIVVSPKPTPEAMAKARHLVDSLIVALRAGADFETVARQYSMDGSKDQGGDLHWHRRGDGTLVREFEDAAFALKPGTISDPVVTQFGIHIIQVARVQPNEAHIYHILIIPEMDSSAAAAAAKQAEDIRQALMKGASFDSIQRLVHDMNEERGTERPYPIDKLPPFYVKVPLTEVGKVAPVMVLSDSALGPLRNKYAVVLVTGKFPAGPTPYDAVREVIRTGLAGQNGEDAYLKELRRRIYVDIKNQ